MNQTIQHRLRGALTARELRHQLANCPDDAKVLFVCDYGDHGHTQQALPVGEILEMTTGNLLESGYSQSGIAAIMEDCNEDNEEYGDPIVILR